MPKPNRAWLRGRFLAAMAFCALPVASSPPIKAETIGLRFVIDSSLADSRTAQEILLEKYRRQVADLNEIYRNSLVDLHAEIVQIGFAPIQSNDAATLFEDMAKERGGFEKLLATADEYGADYTIAIVDNLVALGRRVCGKAIAVNKTMAEIADSTRAAAVIDVARYYAAHESPDVHVLPYRDQRLQDCISIHYRGLEIAEMTELICPSAGIESLEGIDKLKHLKRIDLRNNRIAYPDALLSHPPNALERIDLSENNEIPCSKIDALIRRFGDKLKQPDYCKR